MTGTLKQVRFKLAWQTYSVGDVATPNGTQRDWLLANGYVELVEPALPDRKGRVTDKTKVVEQAKGGLFTR